MQRTFRFVVGVVIISPCALPAQGAVSGMPQLRRVPFTGGIDTLLWKPVPAIAVSRSGRVAGASDVAEGRNEGTILQILSPASNTLLSVGRHGEGPGELSGAGVPFARGDTFDVFDLRRAADVRYSDAGRYLGETRIGSMSDQLIAFHGDSVDVAPLALPGHPPGGVWRRKIGETTGRVLVAATDSFLIRLSSRRSTQPGVLPGMAYQTSTNRIAVGDGLDYRIALYDARGRLLYVITRRLAANYRSPAQTAALRTSLNAMLRDSRQSAGLGTALRVRLDTLGREHVPYFSAAGLHFDAAGRLWVIGAIGDSTFADVFAGVAWVGRRILPCANPDRRIALQGRWLALDCEHVTSSGAAPFQVQLYAIEQ